MSPADTPEVLTSTAEGVYEAICREWELSPVELTTLTRACRQLSMAERLDAAVDRDGEMIPGAQGQLRLNPAIAEARAASESAARLLNRLGLKDAIPSPTSLRGQKAARSRWAQEKTRRAATYGS